MRSWILGFVGYYLTLLHGLSLAREFLGFHGLHHKLLQVNAVLFSLLLGLCTFASCRLPDDAARDDPPSPHDAWLRLEAKVGFCKENKSLATMSNKKLSHQLHILSYLIG